MMKKIFFCKVQDGDWDFLVEIRNESRHFHSNTSFFTKKEYMKYINDQLNQDARNRHWIIMYGDQRIGHAKIINQIIGYSFASEFRGKGLLKFVFNTFEKEALKLGYKKMLGRVKVDHPVSLWMCMKHEWYMTGLETNVEPNLIEYKLARDIDTRKNKT